MGKRRSESPRLLLPWESGSGWSRRLGLHRVTWLAAACLVATLLILVTRRERERSEVRQTRVVLAQTRAFVDAFLAEQGRCPADLAEAAARAHLVEPRRDGWGQPLEFRCPAESSNERYELTSSRW